MSFSLQPQDVLEYNDADIFSRVKVTMRDAQGDTWLTIYPLSSRSNLSTTGRRSSGLRKDLKAWKNGKGSPEGQPMYPPCTIHPMAEAGWRLYPLSILILWLGLLAMYLRHHDSAEAFNFWIWSFMCVGYVYLWAVKRPHRRKLATAKPTLPAITNPQEEERCLTTKI